jgi:hypothetical protein
MVAVSQGSNINANHDLSAVLSNTWGPFYFFDKHYPENNGFYECEMAEDMVGTIS